MKLIRDKQKTEPPTKTLDTPVTENTSMTSAVTKNKTFTGRITAPNAHTSWKILVVDDEPEVHAVTKLSVSNLVFDGKPVKFVSAMSGTEAREILATEPDFAVALIDIVMETEDAGLRLINHIRNELNNRQIRLIIRTGQPGSAPERYVIDHYDIDDYKDKTELTTPRLYTTLRTTLKAYRELTTIEHNRQGLNKILEAAPHLYRLQPREELFADMLNQIKNLCPLGTNNVLIATKENTHLPAEAWNAIIRVGTGKFVNHHLNPPLQNALIYTCKALLDEVNFNRMLPANSLLLPMVLYNRWFGYVYLEEVEMLTDNDQHLLQIMVTQCTAALKNLELYHDLEAANRQNERKNLFLGMAAHDLRNPLGIIRSSEELLQESGLECLDGEQLQYLYWIKFNSQLTLNLVDDLLDVAKIESGKLELELKLTNLLLIIGSAVSSNRILANTKQIRLDFNYEGNIPNLMLDGSKIQQVINNLVSNAIKYSHPHKNVLVQVKRHDNEIVLSVKDEGQGIPKDELAKLFEPFAKTSTKSTAGEASTGLGLMICRQIVEAHQGRIWVESIVGIGSTFYTTFPLNS